MVDVFKPNEKEIDEIERRKIVAAMYRLHLGSVA